jgi:uncharacterized sulfatase
MALAPFAPPKTKPNVLWVMADDQNTHLGCYGHPVISPNIDSLARSGTRFEHAYCQYPLCNPARSSLLTGRRPLTTKVLDNGTWFRDFNVLPDVVTLPQHFRQNGYWTASAGKVFHVGDDPSWDVVDRRTGRVPNPRPRPERQQTYEQHRHWLDGLSPAALEDRKKTMDCWVATEGDGEDLQDYKIASTAIQYLENRRKDQPFFVAAGFLKPHAPFIAPKKYFDLYDPASMKLPADFTSNPEANLSKSLSYRPNADIFIKRDPTPELAREAIAGYHAATSFMDAQVGRVLAALDRLHLRENTLIIYCVDHGWFLGEKGLFAKESLFEPAMHVPLIFSAPWIQGGKVCQRPIEWTDVYPTLCELCGLPLSEGLEGKSLAELVKNPTAPWERPAYSYMRWGNVIGRSLRTQRYRYTEWDHGKLGKEMFDHQTDPGEMHDLASDPKHAQTAAKLKSLLAAIA